MLIIGEGGMGKTTALLQVWERHLEEKKRLPLYIPLNEYVDPENDTFIADYIRLYYQIELAQLTQPLCLMLDGFNEISVPHHKLIFELKNLLGKKAGKMKTVITSRNDLISAHNLATFAPFHLVPLSDETVQTYIDESGMADSGVNIAALRTPMMLSLFAENCTIQKTIQTRNDALAFKPSRTTGELIYNYLLCHIAKLMIEAGFEEIYPMYAALFLAARFIAHDMESRGDFHITKQRMAELVAAFLTKTRVKADEKGQARPQPCRGPLQHPLQRRGARGKPARQPPLPAD